MYVSQHAVRLIGILTAWMLQGVVIFIELVFFFFQAEDGIRDVAVTGVQTCALPISAPEALRRQKDLPARRSSARRNRQAKEAGSGTAVGFAGQGSGRNTVRLREGREIGRASCRERV